jgi:hypothetical protein
MLSASAYDYAALGNGFSQRMRAAQHSKFINTTATPAVTEKLMIL